MNEELAPHGLEFIKAKNDRAGGAQLIYTMLQNYQLKIAHTCTNTIEAIESRLHDEKEPVKVKKVPTDPLDDFYDFYRYGIYSYLETPTKPYGMRVAERLKKAIEVDPTRAVVDYNKILREEKNEEEPQQYSRHAGRQRRMSELERARRPNR
jgi:hypothetical protein